MSENLDLVRSVFAEWERGEFGSADWAHPEIDYLGPDGPDPGEASGRAGMAAIWQEVLGAWDDLKIRAEAYREIDDVRVVALVEFCARGKSSGADVGEMRAKGAALFEIRDGEVIRLVTYWNRDRALADLGLEE